MHFSFTNAEAAEMVLRTNQNTHVSLEVMSVSGGYITMKLLVTLDGEPIMFGDDIIRMSVGDTIEVPRALDIQFTTA